MESSFTGIGSHIITQDEYATNAVDIFSLPQVDSSTTGGRIVASYPATSSVTGPWTFHFRAQGDTYVDSSSLRLSGNIVIKKVKQGGVRENLDGQEKVTVVDQLPNMLFQKRHFFVGGKLINMVTQPFSGIKTVMENNLSYDLSASETFLAAEHVDLTEITAAKDFLKAEHFPDRIAPYTAGKKVPFCIDLQIDILKTERYLLPGIDYSIELIKVEDSFLYFTAEAALEIEITLHDLKLECRRVELSPSIITHHKKLLSSGQTAKYPFVRGDIRVVGIPSNSMHYRVESIYRQSLPIMTIAAFVSQTALAGRKDDNPLNFLLNIGANCYISKVFMNVNSEQFPPNGYQQTPTNYMESYRRFMDQIGIMNTSGTNNITPAKWVNGSTMFGFDLTPDSCNGFHYHKKKPGDVNYEVFFSGPTPKPLSMIMINYYHDILEIDQYGNAITMVEQLTGP